MCPYRPPGHPDRCQPPSGTPQRRCSDRRSSAGSRPAPCRSRAGQGGPPISGTRTLPEAGPCSEPKRSPHCSPQPWPRRLHHGAPLASPSRRPCPDRPPSAAAVLSAVHRLRRRGLPHLARSHRLRPARQPQPSEPWVSRLISVSDRAAIGRSGTATGNRTGAAEGQSILLVYPRFPRMPPSGRCS